MVIIRNDKLITNRARLGTLISGAGLAILIGGFLLTFLNPDNTRLTTIGFLTLPAGWVLAQVGLFFTNRFVRSPRPDEAIDEGLKYVGKGLYGDRLYHYVGPVPHMILSQAGVIGIVSKYQMGTVTADEYKWKQTNIGILKRFFGQESLGNPALEAENQIKQIAKFIGQEVPELAEQELPISAIIVFTRKENEGLDLKKSTIPAMHFTKLSKFWKKRLKDTPMEEETYHLLKERFDAVAERRTGWEIEELEEE